MNKKRKGKETPLYSMNYITITHRAVQAPPSPSKKKKNKISQKNLHALDSKAAALLSS